MEEIALAYQSMNTSERSRCQSDIEKIITTTLRDLICDAPDVVIHGLIVLDHISHDHARFFISSLPSLFVRVKVIYDVVSHHNMLLLFADYIPFKYFIYSFQRYITGTNVTIHRHAVRLSGSLAVHLPLTTIGPHLLNMLHTEEVDRNITIKFTALAILYSRTGGGSSTYLQEFSKDALDVCVDYLDFSNIVLSVPLTSKGGFDINPAVAIIDFLATLIRVFVLDSLFSHTLLSDIDSDLFQKCREQLPADLDDILNQILISSAVGKEICWRAQANEYPTLQNDPMVASFVAYTLSLPVNVCHEDIEEETQGEGRAQEIEEEVADGAQVFGVVKRAQSLDSSHNCLSPGKNTSPDKPGTPESAGGSSITSIEKAASFRNFKSYSMDDDRPSPLSSPLASPLRKTPSKSLFPSQREGDKAEDTRAPTAPSVRSSAVSPTAFLNADMTSMICEKGSEDDDAANTPHKYPFINITRANTETASDQLVKSDSASTGMTQSLSSNAIATMPYQPPPTSWGLGVGHCSEAETKVSSRSTAGATTASTISSGIASAIPLTSDQEDWQRLATPWLYLPTTENSDKGLPPSAGADGVHGLFTPTKDGPLDKSKLKSLKRPGRNFRSSNTAGANQPLKKTMDSLGETRAYTAVAVDAEDIQWRNSVSVDESEQTMTRQTSSSFSGPFGDIGDAMKIINDLGTQSTEQVTVHCTPMKRKGKANSIFESPPRHELVNDQLPDIGSATPHEKGAYSNDGKRVHLLAHPNESRGDGDSKPSTLNGGIGAKGRRFKSANGVDSNAVFGSTAISVAQIFDDEDLSPAHEVSEQDIENGALVLVHHGQQNPSHMNLKLNIDIENSAMNPASFCYNSIGQRSNFGPYIESPSVSKTKKISLSPSVRGRGGRRGSRRVSPSPRLEEETGSELGEDNKHLPVIPGGNSEFVTDDNGTPLHKSADQFEYLASENINPLEHPSKELNQVTRGLDKNEWPDIFHTLNKMRQLALHHSSTVLNTTCLHPMVMGVVKQADNLRSAVCKNALLAITDMFIGFGRAMDGESQNIMPMLLKRSVDSSAFLSGSANAALCAMMERISVGRAITLLMQYGADHKTAGIRGTTANCVCHLITARTEDFRSSGCKDALDSLKPRLAKFISDPNPNVRAQAREIIRQLVTNGILSRTQIEQIVTPNLVARALQEASGNPSLLVPLSRYSSQGESGLQVVAECSSKSLSLTPRNVGHKFVGSPLSTKKRRPSVVSKAREELRQFDSSDDGEISPRLDAIELGVSGLGSTTRFNNLDHRKEAAKYSALQAAHAKQQIDTMGDLVELPEILGKLSSKNWSERNDAISHVTDAIIERSSVLSKAGKLEGLVEAILEKFEDGSVKVCIHALQSLAKVHRRLPEILPSIYSTVVPAFLTASSSANRFVRSNELHPIFRAYYGFIVLNFRQISVTGSEIFSSLVDLIPPLPLMQKLCSIAVHDKDRLRCAAFRTITSYISKKEGSLDHDMLQRYNKKRAIS